MHICIELILALRYHIIFIIGLDQRIFEALRIKDTYIILYICIFFCSCGMSIHLIVFDDISVRRLI